VKKAHKEMLKALAKDIETFGDVLHGMRDELDAHQGEISSLQRDFLKAVDQNASNQTRIEYLLEQIVPLKEAAFSSRVQIGVLKEDISEAHTADSNSAQEIEDLRARVKALEERQIVFPTYVPGPYVVDGDFYVKVCNVCGESYKLNQIHICRELRPWKDGGLK